MHSLTRPRRNESGTCALAFCTGLSCVALALGVGRFYMMCSKLHRYSLSGMFPGVAVGGAMTLSDVVASVNRLEKELFGVVKATIESTLGQLGTVGAMAVDEFVGQLTAAVSRLGPTGDVRRVVPVEDVPLMASSSVGAVPVGLDAQKDLSVTSRPASMVPSVFGEGTTAGVSSVGKMTATKTGKNLKRSRAGL